MKRQGGNDLLNAFQYHYETAGKTISPLGIMIISTLAFNKQEIKEYAGDR